MQRIKLLTSGLQVCGQVFSCSVQNRICSGQKLDPVRYTTTPSRAKLDSEPCLSTSCLHCSTRPTLLSLVCSLLRLLMRHYGWRILAVFPNKALLRITVPDEPVFYSPFNLIEIFVVTLRHKKNISPADQIHPLKVVYFPFLCIIALYQSPYNLSDNDMMVNVVSKQGKCTTIAESRGIGFWIGRILPDGI